MISYSGNKNIRISFVARFVAVLLLVAGSLAVQAQIVPHNLLPPKPNPPKLVNDFANLLTPEEERTLEAKLVAYDDSTSNQIAIVTVKTMNGYEADQFATEIGHFWGVGGQAKYDNGVVILVSDGTEENGKRRFFIATGYGLEGVLSAITTNAIAEEFLVPNLKNNNYYDAFNETTNAIFKAAAGEYKAPDGYAKRKKGKGGFGGFAFLILIIIIIIIISRNNRGGGGGFMSRRGYSGFPPVIFPGGGWGSGSSGGGFGGGSSGGGGFGGFGGGGFGGGGSGGSW